MEERSRELAVAADANLVVHAGWLQRRLPGMRVEDEGGLVLIDSGLPCDTFNLVCAARLEPGEARARVQAAVAYFRAAGRPFTWWVGPADRPPGLGALLLEAGLRPDGGEVAMAADLASLPAEELPPGLRIERVRDAAGLRDFAAVVAANWSPPDAEVLRFYRLAEAALLGNGAPLRPYVGYLGGRPVAASELTVGGGLVGLYNVCTLAEHRRRGYGGALTLRPLLEARAEGQRTAVLQASAAGASVYARLGFRPFGEVVEYKPTPRPGGWERGRDDAGGER